MVRASDNLAATDVPARPRLPPNLPQAYRQQLERLEDVLTARSDGVVALETVRGLLDRIVLTPSETGGFEIEVQGEVASILALGQAAGGGMSNGGRRLVASTADPGLFDCSAMVVAGTRFNLCRTVLTWPKVA